MKNIELIFYFQGHNTIGLSLLVSSLEKSGLLDTGCIRPAIVWHTIRKKEGTKGKAGSRIATYSSFTGYMKSSPDQGSLKIVCCSFMTTHIAQMRKDTKAIREVLGDTLLVAGGPHATGNPEHTLALGFDHVIAGDGEISLPEFLEELLVGKSAEKIIHGKNAELDSSSTLSTLLSSTPPLELMRGCRSGCRYCQTGRGRVRKRSFDSAMIHLEELRRRDSGRVNFICPDALSYPWWRELLSSCREIGFKNCEFGIFPSELRPESITADVVSEIMKSCAHKWICIGAQSGSPEVLARCGRSHSPDASMKAASIVRQAGLLPLVDIIMGFPEESPTEMRTTIEYMKKMNNLTGAVFQLHYFLPLAGTPWALSAPSPLPQDVVSDLFAFEKAGFLRGFWKDGIPESREICLEMGIDAPGLLT